MKTGALIRVSGSAARSWVGGTRAQVAAIDEACGEFGLAFQIVDDILDVEGVSADLGKTAGKDAASGKPTYPSMYGVEASRRWRGNVSSEPDTGSPLPESPTSICSASDAGSSNAVRSVP
jgi:farnesyl diphosphate synthase